MYDDDTITVFTGGTVGGLVLTGAVVNQWWLMSLALVGLGLLLVVASRVIIKPEIKTGQMTSGRITSSQITSSQTRK